MVAEEEDKLWRRIQLLKSAIYVSEVALEGPARDARTAIAV
jgi:hypothetical protein